VPKGSLLGASKLHTDATKVLMKHSLSKRQQPAQVRKTSMTEPKLPRQKGLLPRLSRYIESLGPYQSLALLAIPTSLVEPLKLVAVAVAGEGHWITGTIMIIAAYATSILFVERLFRIVKPKLPTLPWFERLWTCFIALRGKAVALFR
jgi:hypothetical protein